MIVHGLGGRDSRCQPKLSRARREVAGRGTYFLQPDLRDTVGSLELLTSGPDPEQENQGVAERAKKALIFTTASAPIIVGRSRMLKADVEGWFSRISKIMFKVRLVSRHAVGTSDRQGHYVVKAVGPCHKRPCLAFAEKTEVDNMCAPPIRRAVPGNQRMRRALLENRGKVKVDRLSQEPNPSTV